MGYYFLNIELLDNALEDMLHTVFACASCRAGQVKTKSRLHEETARHHKQHACHPSGLVGGGGRGVQAAERDPLSGCELH